METVAVCITANGMYKLVCENGLYRIRGSKRKDTSRPMASIK